MNTQLNCPVCSYQNITGDTCPNCDADLRVIRMLQELPLVPKPSVWPLRITLLLLIIGIGLGVATSWIFSQPQFNTVVVSNPSPVHQAINPPDPSPNLSRQLLQRGEPHASLLKPGNPPTQLAPQRTGSPKRREALISPPSLLGKGAGGLGLTLASTTYTVQPGDNLSAIAQKLCGTETTWEVMLKANPQLQGKENHLKVGEVLKIPHCQEGIK
ncbi:LysM peptidoglycan-binding domain-containing protein [Nostoc sp. NIES-2111]